MGDQELEAIVQRMIDAGESEENIGIVISGWQDVAGAEAAPPSPAAAARQQATESPAGYLRETIGNVPGDLLEQGRNVVGAVPGMLKTLAGAASEVGQGIGGAIREVVGLDPHYPNPENLAALGGVIPEVLGHYAKYLDGDERALRVRDNPVGTALDMTGVTALGRAATGGLKAAAPAVVSAAKNPLVRGTASVLADVATGGRVSSLRTARDVGKLVDAMGRKIEPPAVPANAGGRLVPSHPKPTVEQAIGDALNEVRRPAPGVVSQTPPAPRGVERRPAEALAHTREQVTAQAGAKAAREGVKPEAPKAAPKAAAPAPRPQQPDPAAIEKMTRPDWLTQDVAPGPFANPNARLLRPDESYKGLLQELYDQMGANVTVKGVKVPVVPEGTSELARAIRQRKHVGDAANRYSMPHGVAPKPAGIVDELEAILRERASR